MADEHMYEEWVSILRQRGHGVAWVVEDAPTADDEEILRIAQAEQRVVVTFDKDFGELAFRRRLPASAGVILFRVRASDPPMSISTVIEILESTDDWAGHFSVIEEGRIRMIPLVST